MQKMCKIIVLFVLMLGIPLEVTASGNYLWLAGVQNQNTLVNRIAPPQGYERIPVPEHSFAGWLRHIPLKEGKPPVYLYDGRKKRNQSTHHAVVDIDVGNQNLQQCADAVIRLRAEYLYSIRMYGAIHFNFTSGDEAAFSKWIEGYRPVVKGNMVTWHKSHAPDSSYASFTRYLNTVFMYAGSYSLEKELRSIKNISKLRIGDVFIQGGFPGHAVLVIDMAVHRSTSKRIFLLAQSYMPAQDVHILVNPSNKSLSPWYELAFSEKLYTPEWTFHREQLRRFPSEEESDSESFLVKFFY